MKEKDEIRIRKDITMIVETCIMEDKLIPEWKQDLVGQLFDYFNKHKYD